jgi:hypothetical protein
MSHSTTTSRVFAECLIGHEGRVNSPSPDGMPTALPVIEKLGPALVTFMGRAGYRALLLRALVLARREVPWLCDVEIAADGGLENFAGLSAEQDPAEATHGSEVLLAGLFDLLVAFIGEILTLRLVHGLWPVVSHDATFTQNKLS